VLGVSGKHRYHPLLVSLLNSHLSSSLTYVTLPNTWGMSLLWMRAMNSSQESLIQAWSRRSLVETNPSFLYSPEPRATKRRDRAQNHLRIGQTFGVHNNLV
jgi:hypothetical protein